MNQPDNSGIIFPQDEYDDFVDLLDHTSEKIHVTKNTCSDDFVVEANEGVLRVCTDAEDKEYTKEGLRIIAELRAQTTLIIEETCNNHRRGHHTFGDTLNGIFDELLDAKEPVKNMIENIIQFPNK